MGIGSRRGWPSIFGAMAAITVLGPLLAAMAQAAKRGPSVTVDWIAPDTCPDAAYVEGEIVRLLAGSAAAETTRLRAHAVVSRDRSGPWHVELSTASAGALGHRSVTAETCRVLADVTALILALAVDPERVARNREAPIDGSASVEADASLDAEADAVPSATAPASAPAVAVPIMEASADTTPMRARPSTQERNRSTTFAVGVYALADLGTLPYLGPGAGVQLAAIPSFAPATRLEIGAGVWMPQSIARAMAPAGGHFDLRAFDVAVCLVPPFGRWELGACVGGEVGWMTGSGTGSDTTVGQSSDAFWPILRPRAVAAYLFNAQWAVRCDLGVGVSFAPPQFAWEGVGGGNVQSPAVVAARGAVGLEARF